MENLVESLKVYTIPLIWLSFFPQEEMYNNHDQIMHLQQALFRVKSDKVELEVCRICVCVDFDISYLSMK